MGNTKTLEDGIHVTAIFGREQTKNGSLKEVSVEKNSDRKWNVTVKARLYVPVLLALTGVNKEHLRTLQELLKAQYLDLEVRIIFKLVGNPLKNFILDTNGLPYMWCH